ncbi:MAG: hypothetical protein LC722_08065 [Actinobacteria bacterium]|nr:hypothetical protein [Actinomycetota bacterium]
MFARLSGWTIESSEGVIATSRQRNYDRAVDRALPEILEKAVEHVGIRNGALGLTIRLSGGASILVLPDRTDVRRDPHEEVWELFGPGDLLLLAVPAEGLIFGDPHAPA